MTISSIRRNSINVPESAECGIRTTAATAAAPAADVAALKLIRRDVNAMMAVAVAPAGAAGRLCPVSGKNLSKRKK